MSDDDTLAEYEALYGETGNPLYVWMAIDHLAVFGGPDRRPLPDWIRDYLDNVAGDLMALAEDRTLPSETDVSRRAERSAETKADAVKSALGLARRGKNAFREFAADRARAFFAFWHDTAGRGDKAKRVADEAQRLSTSEETVRDRNRRARKLWKAQADHSAKRRR